MASASRRPVSSFNISFLDIMFCGFGAVVLLVLIINSNIITNLNPKTGAVHFGPERLDAIDGVYASPVGAADRVYVVGRNGTTVVLKRGPHLEVLATNTLDDGFDASPAIAGAELFLRGKSHLYCLAED